jgi:hypothetical protein
LIWENNVNYLGSKGFGIYMGRKKTKWSIQDVYYIARHSVIYTSHMALL